MTLSSKYCHERDLAIHQGVGKQEAYQDEGYGSFVPFFTSSSKTIPRYYYRKCCNSEKHATGSTGTVNFVHAVIRGWQSTKRFPRMTAAKHAALQPSLSKCGTNTLHDYDQNYDTPFHFWLKCTILFLIHPKFLKVIFTDWLNLTWDIAIWGFYTHTQWDKIGHTNS